MPAAAPQFKHRNLPLLLLQSRERIFSRFRPLLNAVGITEQQWRVLRAVLENGPLEPRQIGAICCLSSPSLAGILARMDDLGLISRERFANDQRRVLVTPTADGESLALELAPKIESKYQELEGLLGKKFIKEIYASMDELLRKLEGEGGEVDA